MATAQIDLDEEAEAALDVMARQMGKTREELIREAVQRFVLEFRTVHRAALLQQACGMWKDRADLPFAAEYDAVHAEAPGPGRELPDAVSAG